MALPYVARITDMGALGSGDPSGVTYRSDINRLVVVDSEADERPYYSDTNLFELSLGGSLREDHSLTGFTIEPTGAAYHALRDTLFVSDDDRRLVFEVDPDAPELPLRSFDLARSGVADLEDVEVNPNTGNLYLVDEANRALVETTVAGDFVRRIDLPATLKNPEAVAYDAAADQFYVSGFWSADIFKVDQSGAVVDTLKVLRDERNEDGGRVIPKGLALAPTSDAGDAADARSLYVADYGKDQVGDGRLFEIVLDTGSTSTPSISTSDSILIG